MSNLRLTTKIMFYTSNDRLKSSQWHIDTFFNCYLKLFSQCFKSLNVADIKNINISKHSSDNVNIYGLN